MPRLLRQELNCIFSSGGLSVLLLHSCFLCRKEDWYCALPHCNASYMEKSYVLFMYAASGVSI